MGSQKDLQSDEDIPSDFFDDFNKEDFIQGLSVIDSWNDDDGLKRRTSRIDAQAVESVKDLRELIGDGKDDERHDDLQRRRRRESHEPRRSGSRSHRDDMKPGSRIDDPRFSSRSHLDDYIKPGSRRDPNKTNEAIRRDKEVKVKEHIAKRLESSDDLRPPGTELEDFFEGKPQEVKKVIIKETKQGIKKTRSRSRERRRRESPVKYRRKSPWKSPIRSPIRIPRRRPSPRHFSPQRRYTNRRLSPIHLHRALRWSPHRRSPRRERRSRSPYRSPYRSPIRSSRSRSRSRGHRDSFLYPQESQPPPIYSQSMAYQEPIPYGGPVPVYSGVPGAPAPPGFPYAANAGYPESFGRPYEYGAPVMPTENIPIPVPQPVPAPIPVPVPAPVLNPTHIPLPSSAGPPAPVGPRAMAPALSSFNTSNDPLAQLVAEGKLSREDYLKLAPNKGKSALVHGAKAPMDTKTRIEVLNRCHDALAKLGQLKMPSRLVMNNALVNQEPLSLTPKFCSPLKRQAAVEFNFTKPGASAASVFNKRLIEGIIRVFGLKNVIARPKKKTPKNMKDAAVQTNKPYCDVCEIRDSTKFYDAGTSIDQDHFSSAVHTQVVEQDLVSSKAVFNPSGSIADGAPISIAHLTPAQLVSQLAARAKTLKQSDTSQSSTSNQYQRFPNNYDGRGSQHHQYQNNANQYPNNYNYRY